MTWFVVDDGFTHSKPVMNLPDRHRLAAVGLWTLAGAWSAKEETDGAVPRAQLRAMGGTPAVIAALCDPGPLDAALWERTATGIQFKNWSKWQKTRAELVEERRENAERQRKWREEHPAAGRGKKRKGRISSSSDDSEMSQCDVSVTDNVTDDAAANVRNAVTNNALTGPDLTGPLSTVVTSGGGVTEGDGQQSKPPPPTALSVTGPDGDAASGPPSCPRHPGGPDHSEPCRVCAAVRVHRDQKPPNGLQNDAQREQQRIERDRDDRQRRMAIRRCQDCDTEGRLDWTGQGGIVFDCPHDSRLYRTAHDEQYAALQERQARWELWNYQREQDQLVTARRDNRDG